MLKEEDVVLEKTPLSQGGFGVVYKCTWKDKEVAVKIMIHGSRDTSEEDQKKEKINFEKEADLIYSLDHENVVKV